MLKTGYLTLFRNHTRMLLFGLFMTFFSSYGQTYHIGLYREYFIAHFGLSDLQFSSLYSLATLGSAALLPFAGRLIDKVHLLKYSVSVILGLCLSLLLIPFTPWVPVLFVAILGLRLCGQGLLTHTAFTAMGRYLTTDRGKATSIAGQGLPLGEAIYTSLIIAMIAAIGWQETLWVSALGVAVVLIPLVVYFLQPLEGYEEATGRQSAARPSNKAVYRALFSDWVFYVLAFFSLALPFISTGVFFYQTKLVEEKGWELGWIGAFFVAYAVAKSAGSLTIGQRVDDLSARKLYPLVLLPFIGGLLLMHFADAYWAGMLGYITAGISLGANSPVKNALLVEFYGTETLGTVRSLFSTLLVFSTSLAPVLMGLGLDQGWRINQMLLGLAGLGLLASLVAMSLWFKKD